MSQSGYPSSGRGVPERVSSPVMILGGPSTAASELTRRLRAQDVKVLHSPNRDIAAKGMSEDGPALVIADMRPSRCVEDAEAVLEELRAAAEPLAVLFWFDPGIDAAWIAGLCGPLDDLVLDPWSIDEVLLRLQLLSARVPAPRGGERLRVGDLELDTAHRTVTRAGADIDLSATEFRLLRLLMRHSRTVLSKSEILQDVWEYEFAGQANIVELYISYLRKKIEAGMPRMIHTVRGAGYVLRPAGDPREDEVTEE